MKTARDTWLIFQREIGLMFGSPIALAFSLGQPLTYLIFFAPFLRAAMAGQGAVTYADAYRIYVPGLLVAMGLFSGLFAGYALLQAIRGGIIDRCRVTPVSRASLLLGRALKDVVTVAFQGAVIVLAALPFGLRVALPDLLVAFVLLALMTLLSTAISYAVALLVGNENSLGAVVNTIGQPVSLLAGVLIPIALAPLWIQEVSVWNPFAWATHGMRALFDGRAGDPVVWQGMAIVTVLMVATVLWSTRLFGRETR